MAPGRLLFQFMPRSAPPVRSLLRACSAAAATSLLLATAAAAQAQPRSAEPDQNQTQVEGRAAGAGASTEDPVIQLDFSEQMPVEALISLVTRELELNLVYDGSLAGETLQMSLQRPVRRSQLRNLLSSVLYLKDKVLVPIGVDGFVEIRDLQEARGIGTNPEEGSGDPNEVIFRVFDTGGGSASQFQFALEQLLGDGAVLYADEQRSRLVVSDTRARLDRVAGLLEDLATPPQAAEVVRVDLEHASAKQLAQQLQQTFQARARSVLNAEQASYISITADTRTNQVLMVLPKLLVDEAVQLAEALDTPVASQAMPVQRYKLLNTTAKAMLRTLRQVSRSGRSSFGDGFDDLADGRAGPLDTFDTGIENDGFDREGGFDPGLDDAPPAGSRFRDGLSRDPAGLEIDTDEVYITETGIPVGSLAGREVNLAADEATNSIIVVADPATQAIYADLIQMLDERRPQVQIEATIISIDTSDALELGVEFASNDSVDDGRLITFGAFGISNVDAVNGTLAPSNTLGVTAALLGTDFADVIIRTLAADEDARVVSSPTIMVADNETGTIKSVRQEPTLTVVQGEVTSQVTFGEFVEAGTTIRVTPNISADGYLQLRYDIDVSSFRAADPALAAAGVPPPKQTVTASSPILVPHGHTVVVGGLNQVDNVTTVRKLPLLGDVPILGHLFKSTAQSEAQRTIFIFIKPTILDADDFGDLKSLTIPELQDAGLTPDADWDEPELLD